MIVYHGGTDIVDAPKIIRKFAGRDFGAGFYTTDIIRSLGRTRRIRKTSCRARPSNYPFHGFFPSSQPFSFQCR